MAFALSACAAQATTDYEGEPLLTLTGRVDLSLTDASEDLAPAIAFMAPEGNEVHFMEAL